MEQLEIFEVWHTKTITCTSRAEGSTPKDIELSDANILFAYTLGVIVMLLLLAGNVIVAWVLFYYRKIIMNRQHSLIVAFYLISLIMNFARIIEIFYGSFLADCIKFSSSENQLTILIFGDIASLTNYLLGIIFIGFMFSVSQSFKLLQPD